MAHCNLLYVGNDDRVAAEADRVIRKVYGSSLLFEVNNLEDARKLLRKMRIQVVLTDHQSFESSVPALRKEFRDTLFLVRSNNSGEGFVSKKEFAEEIREIMKQYRKAHPGVTVSTGKRSFGNYESLLGK